LKEEIEMLLLSRKRGEGVVIGNGIRVTVLEMHGDRVKLGFEAPAEVPVHRKEVPPRRRFSMDGGDRTHQDPPSIAEEAMNRLRDSPYKAMRRVSCEWRHGVLVLRGRLFSFHEKQVAQEIVAAIGGVAHVANEIEVNGSPVTREFYRS
jgi:carbon storage regulator CsrA